jgi:hypothetical protein
MNSLTQQFAALTSFSEGLLAAPVPSSVLEIDQAEADAAAAAALKVRLKWNDFECGL